MQTTVRVVLMMNPQTGDVLRVTSRAEYAALKDDGWRPLVLAGASRPTPATPGA